MPISTLLNSCATDAARRPRLEMRSACRRRFSRRRRSLSSATRGRSRLSSDVDASTSPSMAPPAPRSGHAVRNERLSLSFGRRPPDHIPFFRTVARTSETSKSGMTSATVLPVTSESPLPYNLCAAGFAKTILPPASVARTAWLMAFRRASAVNMDVWRQTPTVNGTTSCPGGPAAYTYLRSETRSGTHRRRRPRRRADPAPSAGAGRIRRRLRGRRLRRHREAARARVLRGRPRSDHSPRIERIRRAEFHRYGAAQTARSRLPDDRHVGADGDEHRAAITVAAVPETIQLSKARRRHRGRGAAVHAECRRVAEAPAGGR